MVSFMLLTLPALSKSVKERRGAELPRLQLHARVVGGKLLDQGYDGVTICYDSVTIGLRRVTMGLR